MDLVFDFRCTIKTDFKFYEYVHTSCWAEGNQKLYQNILVLTVRYCCLQNIEAN